MPLKLENIVIKQVTWQQAENNLREIRTSVFIEEQFVTPDFEWDDIDSNAVHLLAIYENSAIGCLRIVHQAKIGRMAVLKHWRGLGVGQALLAQAVQLLKESNHRQISLSAQTHAIKFYEKSGFKVVSDAYLDVNIWHVDMQLVI